MQSPRVNEFAWCLPSVADGTRAAAAQGTSITPATNAYGSYAQLIAGASLVNDVYEIWINVNAVSVSTAAHNSLVTIGIDESGGTSYTALINDLVCGPAGPYAGTNGSGGVWYRFPLFIKSGSSIGAKGSRSSGTTAFNCWCIVYGRPSAPELIKTGSFVRTFGADTANSTGTAVTDGAASEGAYTQLGSATAENLFYWEFGIGFNDSNVVANTGHHDIAVGDASNKKIVIRNGPVWSSTLEDIQKPAYGAYGISKAGDLVYARAQWGAGAAETGFAMAAYGVGGAVS